MASENYCKIAAYEEAQNIDELRLSGIRAADHKCRNLPMGQIQWTPRRSAILHRMRYFKMLCASISGSRKVNARTLLKTRLKANIVEPIYDMDTAQAHLLTEFTEFREYKQQHTSLRQEFLDELATAKALHTNADQATTLKQLMDRESTRSIFRKIKIATGSFRKGVTCVEVTHPLSGEVQLLHSKYDIEQACMKENEQRFTQASHTPTLMPSQINKLGWTANTPTAASILNNSIHLNDSGLHENIIDLAPFLTTPPSISELGNINTHVTLDAYRAAWKNAENSPPVAGLAYILGTSWQAVQTTISVTSTEDYYNYQ
jgi:hypothetical protein